MGFIKPTPPPVDVEEWKQRSHLDKIKPLAQDWAINGFGTPEAVFLLYIVKLALFVLGAALVIGATPGLAALGDIGDWWTEPIVWQKLVVWLVLWEFLGLGSSSMALTLRFIPPIGSVLFWLRPGCVRLPPWPDRVPFTKGTTRTWFDVALAAAVYAACVYLLASDGVATAASAGGRLDTTAVAVLVGLLVVLGLRDKVSYLSTRPEVYGILLVVFLFPLDDMVVASQVVLLCVWWAAAASKLNHHFPYVVSVMESNAPLNRSRALKRRLWVAHPENLQPSRASAFMAHAGTALEFALPLLLFVSDTGVLVTIGIVGMLLFHLHITSTFPLAVPLEWNLFTMFGIVYLFGQYSAVPLSSLDEPLLIALLVLNGVAIPVIGNLRPDKVSFLAAMRYYAGNWATSWWLFRKDGAVEDRVDREVKKSSSFVARQLERLYDRDTAELLLYKGLAFRSMHSHGRALNALLPRAVEDVEAYDIRDGEVVAGAIVGYNFGDGHFHDAQLLGAVRERVAFEEGELRVITLESQPLHDPRQRYRIHDARSGLLEEGWVDVADMRRNLPWLDERWGSFEFDVKR